MPVLEREYTLYGPGLFSPAPLSYHYCLRKDTIEKLRLRGAPASIVPLLPCLPRRSAALVVFYDNVVHNFHEDAVSAGTHEP